MDLSLWLRFFLPAYYIVFVVFVLAIPVVRQYRRTGHNPITLGTSDNAYDFIGRLMKAVFALLALDIALYAGGPLLYAFTGPLPQFESDALRIGAHALFLLALVWVAVAQSQMGNAFRIGIDREHRTELVAAGLYRHSRNPIYVGLMALLLALLVVLPNTLSIAVVANALALIHIQTRLEEEHLRGLHGEAYEAYWRRVRRWL